MEETMEQKSSLSITSVSLPVALVGQILEEWLNTHWLRMPLRVTEVDVVDAYDRADGVVHVSLALAAAGGNGHGEPETGRHGDGEIRRRGDAETPQPAASGIMAEIAGEGAPEEGQAAAAAPKRRRYTAAEAAEVSRLRDAGLHGGAIIRQTGLSAYFVYSVLSGAIAGS